MDSSASPVHLYFNVNIDWEKYEKAWKRQTSEAELGAPISQFFVDVQTDYGITPEVPLEERESNLKQLISDAKQGNWYAQTTIGLLHEEAIGVPLNDESAFYCYRDASGSYQGKKSEQGNIEIEKERKKKHEAKGERSRKWSVEIAWVLLATYYHDGRVVGHNSKRALRLYREGESARISTALLNIGTFHQHGLGGLVPDEDKARECYALAASLGHCRGEVELGLMKEDKGDHRGALEVYLRAAARGHPVALFYAGLLYLGVPESDSVCLRGREVESDPKKGMELLRQAGMEKENYWALVEGARIYQAGMGVAGVAGVVDHRSACEWFYRAACLPRREKEEAYAAIGCKYAIAEGVPEDLAKAFQFIKASKFREEMDWLTEIFESKNLKLPE